MRTWTAHTTSGARTDALLDAFTDPAACRRWAPIAFDVEVHEAGGNALRLSASGPVRMDVAYQLSPRPDGGDVSASVSVHPGRGLLGAVLAEATNGLLKAGALSQAVDRLAREAALA